MPDKWSPEESQGLTKGLERVLAENRFWPEQEHFDLINQLVPLAATEVAVVRGGKLLLQYRAFAEWPAPYDRAGWYIPGGYCFWPEDMRRTCLTHIRKDLRGEYRRVEIEFNLDSIEIAEPVVIGVKKWMPGDHPFGCPISLICVCELLAGDIIETEWLKWSEKTLQTNVPWHRSFQDAVFAYLKSPPEMKRWLSEIHSKIDFIV